MRIYINEDTVSRSPVRLLPEAGQEIVLPSEVNLLSRTDPEHLTHTIE